MSLTSLENYCESIEVILLQAQTALSGFQIVREMEDSAADKDRIVVKCDPRKIAVISADGIRPAAYQFDVSVTLRLATRSSADFDTCIAAIEAANNSDTCPPAATAIADSVFTKGLVIYPTDEGEVAHGDNVRERTKVFTFRANV